MDFAVIDLFGGTTELFESQQEALLAADELLERYRRQATIDEWHDPDYMSAIMVMQVSHRVTPISTVTAIGSDIACAHWDYRVQAVQRV